MRVVLFSKCYMYYSNSKFRGTLTVARYPAFLLFLLSDLVARALAPRPSQGSAWTPILPSPRHAACRAPPRRASAPVSPSSRSTCCACAPTSTAATMRTLARPRPIRFPPLQRSEAGLPPCTGPPAATERPRLRPRLCSTAPKRVCAPGSTPFSLTNSHHSIL